MTSIRKWRACAHFEREAEAGSDWTTYNPSLGRMLLNTEKFLHKEKEEEVTAAAAAASGTDTVPSPGSEQQVESVAGIEVSLPFTEEKV